MPAEWNRDRIVAPLLRQMREVDRLARRAEELPGEVEAANTALEVATEACGAREAAWRAGELAFAEVLGARERLEEARRVRAALGRELHSHLGQTLDGRLEKAQERFKRDLLDRDGAKRRASELVDEVRRLEVRRAERDRAAARHEERERANEARQAHEARLREAREQQSAEVARYLGAVL
ncbi:hypothetical protein [Haloactinopolyspora sp.]|uniref:hypothetical protein n=1 Tax=Haloactinopolyspora sp. TaxID=1966353 RepID=UPI00263A357F|nr:hypothetical protein [Haloactinopolyspora sp.]